MLKEPIRRDLLPRLRSFEGMGQKVTFGETLAATEGSVDAAVEGMDAGPKAVEGSGSGSEDDRSTLLAKEAESNPSFSILSAYERLNGALGELVSSRLPVPDGGRRVTLPFQRLRDLQKNGVVNENFVSAVNQLRLLRNDVAHGQHNPSAGEAVAYVESAEELTRAARVLANMGGTSAQ